MTKIYVHTDKYGAINLNKLVTADTLTKPGLRRKAGERTTL